MSVLCISLSFSAAHKMYLSETVNPLKSERNVIMQIQYYYNVNIRCTKWEFPKTQWPQPMSGNQLSIQTYLRLPLAPTRPFCVFLYTHRNESSTQLNAIRKMNFEKANAHAFQWIFSFLFFCELPNRHEKCIINPTNGWCAHLNSWSMHRTKLPTRKSQKLKIRNTDGERWLTMCLYLSTSHMWLFFFIISTLTNCICCIDNFNSIWMWVFRVQCDMFSGNTVSLDNCLTNFSFFHRNNIFTQISHSAR